jgi:RNA polymerase sigma factor (TIGR02999 family)
MLRRRGRDNYNHADPAGAIMPTSDPPPGEVTEILRRASAGERAALDQVFPLVYDQLRRLARRRLAGQPAGHTVTTTVLIHEVYLRLVDQREARFEDRARFFAYAASVMRAVLVDEARARTAGKRGGGWTPVELDERDLPVDAQAELVLAVHEALAQLAGEDGRLAQLVECRFFGGLSDEDVAQVLGVTDRTVRRDWVKARTWLHSRLTGEARA